MHDVYLAGAAAWLPPATSPAAALAAGGYTADENLSNKIVCLPTAGPDDHPTEMAVRAGTTALARAGVDPDGVGLVLHASLYHQGRDFFWSPVSHVQHGLGLTSAYSVNVGQMSNGGMAALSLAVAHLKAGVSPHAVVTTGDRFCEPGFFRWTADYGIVYGDGATAAVLSTAGGFAKLLAFNSLTDPALERLHRGTEPLTAAMAAGPSGAVVDVRAVKKSYLIEVGVQHVLEATDAGMKKIVADTLAQAELTVEDMRWVVLPSMGHALLEAQFLKPFGILEEQTTMSFGARTGHLGAGDQIASLAHLAETGALAPGDRVLLLGSGGGFSWSAAVLQIESAPQWPEATTHVELPDEG